MTADAYMDAAAAVVGLTISAPQRDGVARFLGIAADMAAILDAFPLDDGVLAMAPVFRLPESPPDE
ncbi:DUF4089 domain-containing protein [Fertoebacter nigrum]|uniref:DUF4089 domain-containing protein n=1 Tax=Fertoeibacter niger TaxID=2656921 RepID=A0A8X8KQA8_9RHOB|nr:DUF4089 domain-containing protein [Fertoeibacter niger]NUB45756.1 DUF4089 domain-containing protein [Fertoeibacter niger]